MTQRAVRSPRDQAIHEALGACYAVARDFNEDQNKASTELSPKARIVLLNAFRRIAKRHHISVKQIRQDIFDA